MARLSTTEEFIEKAKKIHNDKYDYSKGVYVDSRIKFKIICPIHGKFFQTPHNHLRYQRCPECSNISRSEKQRMTIEEFVEKAKRIHGNKYDYSLIKYVNNRTKIEIICSKHGSFFQTPDKHLIGRGCQECGGSSKSSTDKFVKKAKKVHGNKYDYSEVEYVVGHLKVKIICSIHGSFFLTPSNHLRGQGCRKCGIILRNKKNRLTTEKFIEKAKKIHGDRYDYSQDEYVSAHTKYKIICAIHGPFSQTPNSHLNGVGCPKCVGSVSYISQRWFEYLNNKNIITEYYIKIDKKRFIVDGYDPTINTIFEFNGDFFHGNPKIYNLNDYNERCKKTFGQLYKETKNKERFLKKHGYNVISIWESDFKESNLDKESKRRKNEF